MDFQKENGRITRKRREADRRDHLPGGERRGGHRPHLCGTGPRGWRTGWSAPLRTRSAARAGKPGRCALTPGPGLTATRRKGTCWRTDGSAGGQLRFGNGGDGSLRRFPRKDHMERTGGRNDGTDGLDPQGSSAGGALPATVPVMTGFLCLGVAYGVLMETKGYGPVWSVLMSAIAFGGSMQSSWPSRC